MVKYVEEGQRVPFLYVPVYQDWNLGAMVCYPLGVHIIAKWWIKALDKRAGNKREHEAYRAGSDAGARIARLTAYRDGYDSGFRAGNEATMKNLKDHFGIKDSDL